MQNKPIHVLSIDWDYFVEEDPMLDFGHNESNLFLTTMWDIRRTKHRFEDGKLVVNEDNVPIVETADLKEMLPFRGTELDILALPCLSSGYTVGLAESHVAILDLIKDKKNLEVINIDAHHDIHYGHPADAESKATCGNWGSRLVTNRQVTNWTQIYPEWRKKFPEDYSKVSKWMKNQELDYTAFTGVPIKQIIKWRRVDYVFICRSGGWTPPDYDEKFNKFCMLMGTDRILDVRK